RAVRRARSPFPTRRSSDLAPSKASSRKACPPSKTDCARRGLSITSLHRPGRAPGPPSVEFREDILMKNTLARRTATLALLFLVRSEEHTSELQSREHLVCR